MESQAFFFITFDLQLEGIKVPANGVSRDDIQVATNEGNSGSSFLGRGVGHNHVSTVFLVGNPLDGEGSTVLLGERAQQLLERYVRKR